nr:hypothetical protein [Candidatus Woesearchaeota archaeon]
MINSLQRQGIDAKVIQNKLREKYGQDIFVTDYSASLLHLRRDYESRKDYEIHRIKVEYNKGNESILRRLIAKTSFHPGEEQIYATGIKTIPEKEALIIYKKNRRKKVKRTLLIEDLECLGYANLNQLILRNHPRIKDIIYSSIDALAYTHKKISDTLRNPNIKANKKEDYISKFKKHISQILNLTEVKFSNEKEKNEYIRDLSVHFKFIAEGFEKGTLIMDKNYEDRYKGTQLVIGHTDLHPGHIYVKNYDSSENSYEDIKIIDFHPEITPWYLDFVDQVSYPSILKNTRFTIDEIKELLNRYIRFKAKMTNFVESETKFWLLYKEDILSMYHLSNFARSIRSAPKAPLMKKRFAHEPDIYERFYLQENPLFEHHFKIYLLNARDHLREYRAFDNRGEPLEKLLGEKVPEFRSHLTLEDFFISIDAPEENLSLV